MSGHSEEAYKFPEARRTTETIDLWRYVLKFCDLGWSSCIAIADERTWISQSKFSYDRVEHVLRRLLAVPFSIDWLLHGPWQNFESNPIAEWTRCRSPMPMRDMDFAVWIFGQSNRTCFSCHASVAVLYRSEGVAWTLTSLCLPYSNEQFARSDLCWIFRVLFCSCFLLAFFDFLLFFLLVFCWLFCWLFVGFVGFLFAFCLLFVCFLFSFCWLFVGFLFAFCWLFVGFLYVPVSQLAPGSLLSEPHAIRTPL